MNRLARFRADPSKIRVSIRRLADREDWQVKVEALYEGRYVLVEHKNVSQALEQALAVAAQLGFPGIDLHMSWSYQHPMWKRNEQEALS